MLQGQQFSQQLSRQVFISSHLDPLLTSLYHLHSQLDTSAGVKHFVKIVVTQDLLFRF